MVKRCETGNWWLGILITGLVSFGAIFAYIFSGFKHHALLVWLIFFLLLFIWIFRRRNQLTEQIDWDIHDDDML